MMELCAVAVAVACAGRPRLVAGACGLLAACSGTGPAATSVAGPTVLTCKDSACHCKKDPGARWVHGVHVLLCPRSPAPAICPNPGADSRPGVGI